MIDLRSDTVTKPTEAMRRAMGAAEVGDDVFGDDPTVNRLQDLAADLTGKDAAIFAPSGTQTNLIGLLSHCQRGDEYIVGANAHTYKYEAGGAAVLGSIQPQPVPMSDNGELDLAEVAAAIKPDDPHFAQARVLCLENTHNGQVMSLEYMRKARDLCDERGLALHLDGARAANAAVRLGVPLRELTSIVDTVSICLSKGLGAPVGSVLCGPADLIHGAKRHRKILGGAMRQAGVIAAAGIHALEHHVDRLADDHARASRLAAGLEAIDGISTDQPETNMVFVHLDGRVSEFVESMAGHGVQLYGGASPLRLVTHLDISDADVDHVIEAAEKSLP